MDMHPQADATFAILAEYAPEAGSGYVLPSMHILLTGHYSLEQVIMQAPRYPNLSIIPSNSDLADAALRLTHRLHHLRQLLDGLSADAFDVVLIDTGKGLYPLAVNARAA